MLFVVQDIDFHNVGILESSDDDSVRYTKAAQSRLLQLQSAGNYFNVVRTVAY